MKNLVKILFVCGVICAIMAIDLGCAVPTVPNSSGQPSTASKTSISSVNNTDLASLVVNLASGQVGNKQGTGKFAGIPWVDTQYTYCDRFVSAVTSVALGNTVPSNYYSGYTDAYMDYTQQDSPINQGTPPMGAIVFYQENSDTNEPGHVGIADGKGNLISVWSIEDGVTEHSLSGIGKPVLGWIYPEEYHFGNGTVASNLIANSTATVTLGTGTQYDQVFTGSIAKSGDYQNFTFNGKSGDIITIHMVQDGGASLQPSIALIDPSGKNITSDSNTWGYSEAWIKNYPLLFSGTYTIRAGGNGNIGGFKVSLTFKIPPVTILYGQEVKGNIAFSDDYQDVKFSGNAGDIITIHMVQDGGASLQPSIALIDPSGTNITSDSNTWGYSEAWIKNYALRFPGTYIIRAGGNGNIGGFKISLSLKPPPVTILYGQEVKGNIAFSDDYQDIKFSGNAGDIITIHMVQDGGASLQPSIALIDPSGKNITSDSNTWGYSEAWIKNYTLIFSGTYTIRTGGNGNIGGYQLMLSKN